MDKLTFRMNNLVPLTESSDLLTASIVDDNPKHRQRLQKMLIAFKSFNEIKIYSSVEEAIATIPFNQPDILFLDVELEDGTGFDILKQINDIKSAIIFTTGHAHYAIDAIRFSASDYLLKPFSKEDVTKALNRVVKERQRSLSATKTLIENLDVSKNQNKRIGINTSEDTHFIQLKNIFWLEAEGGYTTIYLECDEKIIVSKPIKYFEDILSKYGFFRTHKSYIVNLHHVKRYVKNNGGSVELINGKNILVSRRKKEELITELNSLIII